MSKKKKKE